ncbi:glucagon receptor isoform X3 [Paramormyrops kingsleyae]|uniref:glucagon receptor isoform X3 n=1 Tax=Paramormyrops kingsleyae TaxID=1676925 RepID=UPI003B973A9B
MSQVLLLLTALSLSASIQMSYGKIMKTLLEQWKMYKEECLRNITSEPLASGVVCNRTFDRYACWPDAQPNSTISVSCPWYLPWHHKVQHGFVYRDCDSEGRWISMKNASECQLDDSEQLYGKTLSRFLAMYTVGYSLSLGALVLALSILVTFRKLHCTRNNIHMNLFASFILKGVLILLKDVLIDTATPHVIPDDIHSDSQVERLVGGKMAVVCRVAFVMMHYSIIANNYWLLVEGIYLYNLLVVTVFTERNYFNIYLCIGWGAPLIFILPWALAKYLYENEECWQRNDSMAYWWIIRSPILLAIVINFFIFVQIIKILMSKLRAHQMRYTDYKFRDPLDPVRLCHGGAGYKWPIASRQTVLRPVFRLLPGSTSGYLVLLCQQRGTIRDDEEVEAMEVGEEHRGRVPPYSQSAAPYEGHHCGPPTMPPQAA